jgi:carbamoyltransferase
MLICGIHDGHNAAAALVCDGKLLGALQEERITRIKNWNGFPLQAIERLLGMAGACWSDVDAFVYAGKESYVGAGNSHSREAQIEAYKKVANLNERLRGYLKRTPLRGFVQFLRYQRRIKPLEEKGVSPGRIKVIEHHRCHAATAYYGEKPRKEALVMTLDGAGDGLCATVSIPLDNAGLQRLSVINERHSIGILWALITAYMGMVPLEHEYKMMGMAAYASAKRARKVADIFHQRFCFSQGEWRHSFEVPEMNYSYRFWRRNLEFVRFDDVCAGLQLFTEELMSRWVKYWLKRTGRGVLCLSGGVFMNVKMNNILGEIDEVEKLFVFPSCGDETNAIGAAWAYLEDQGMYELIKPLQSMYLGVSPDERMFRQAEDLATSKGYKVYKPADVGLEVASLLARGEIVARCTGREEFGARALGNRSILADPSRPELVPVLNRAIKNRDFWMPFACTVLASHENRYIHNPKNFPAPYMILAFQSRLTEEIIAGVHPNDGTIRPQVLSRETNPEYHHIIEEFARRTGRGAVLNTSFNLHGEPIVSSPLEAMDVFERSGLEHLNLGPYLIHKANLGVVMKL